MRKPVLIGCILGSAAGIVVSLGMDFVLGQNPGAGWRDAVAHDINRALRSDYPPDHFLVTLGVFLIVCFFALIGGASGGFFGSVIAKMFDLLTHEKD